MHSGARPLVERIERRLERLCGEDLLADAMERLDRLARRYGVAAPAYASGRSRRGPWDQRDAVLICYGDAVRADGETPLATLRRFVQERVGDAVSSIHLLPFFPFSSDDGYSVIDYRRVDSLLGTWDDVEALGGHYRLMVDLVINHASAESVWFRNYSNGLEPQRRYFIEVTPGTDLSLVTRPRSEPLLRPVQTPFGERFVWATFGHDQIDLDFRNPDVLFEFLDILLSYVRHRASIVRLDAIAYLWKEPGTPCVHLPQTHEVVKLLRDVLELLAPGVLLITETNVPHPENISYFGGGDEAHMVYQFSLPPLLLHALETGQSRYLTEWARGLAPPPPGCTFFNFTASHDGIGVRPLEGLLPQAELGALLDRMVQKGGCISSRTDRGGSQAPYEVNITYFDALGFPGREDTDLSIARFLCSQTIMLSLQGVPGIYLNSLLAAPNWLAGAHETGRARTINRKKWRIEEIDGLLADRTRAARHVLSEMVRRLRLRATHPAFHPDGPQRVVELPAGLFGIERTAPDQSERIWVVANLTSEPFVLSLRLIDRRLSERLWCELIQGRSAPGFRLETLELAPYQVVWLSDRPGDDLQCASWTAADGLDRVWNW
jgi:sucrose phosphorylase